VKDKTRKMSVKRTPTKGVKTQERRTIGWGRGKNAAADKKREADTESWAKPKADRQERDKMPTRARKIAEAGAKAAQSKRKPKLDKTVGKTGLTVEEWIKRDVALRKAHREQPGEKKVVLPPTKRKGGKK